MPKNVFSADVKVVVVRMVLRGMRFQDIINTLGMGLSLTSVRRWFDLYQRTRAVVTNPVDHMDQGAPASLGAAEKEFILDSLRLDPTLYLDELQTKLFDAFGLRVSTMTLSNELRNRLRWTRKKARTVHPNRSDAARGAYIELIHDIDPRCLVFTDESAISKRRLYRDFARAPVGQRSTRLQRPTAALRFSVLPAISMDGVIACKVQDGGYSRIDFETFLEQDLLPAMNPWPARNSVLVLDNAPIHHGGRVAELCGARGIRLIYLPAYSPDFNPIEKGFSILKARLRRSQILQNALNLAEQQAGIFISTMNAFSEGLCAALYRGCGYL